MSDPTDPPQGTMTNASLTALVRRAVSERLGHAVDPHAGKEALLRQLRTAHGAAAVVEVGLALRGAPPHPVIVAVTSGHTPVAVLQRWMRLERFGHTRNRTELVATDPAATRTRVTVRHCAVDGGAIDPVNDLFMWGLLIALLQRAGFDVADASLTTHVDTPLFAGGEVVLADPLPATTAVLRFDTSTDRCPPTPAAAPPHDDAPRALERLPRLLHADLMRPWKLREAASALAVSVRQLQRLLHADGTTFSEVVQTARVDAARTLMLDRRLSLTEIAFCTGFSDLAHFSRTFRRSVEVPPSALRELLLSEHER